MRFISLLTSIATAGFIASSLAAPSNLELPNANVKRSLGPSQALVVVNALTQQAQVVANNINQALVGITPSSPRAVRVAAGQKVLQQFGTLTTSVNQAVTNVTRQASSQTAPVKRATNTETGDLINALNALVTLIDNTIIQVLSALGLTELVGPVMGILAVVSTFFITIAAVVVDFLPFLGPIGQFIGGIGALIGGIGALIPKGV